MRLRSPRRGEGGGGVFVLLILAVIVLAVTNPNEETHRKRLAEAIPGFKVGSGVGEFLGTAQYRYNNYLVFSTMTVRGIDGKERTCSHGLLGQILVKQPSEWK